MTEIFRIKRSPLASVALVLSLSVFFGGCRKKHSNENPRIDVTDVPSAGQGGPDELERIAGHVSGSLPGQQMMIFSRAGDWWVQPSRKDPYTKIQPDGSWSSSIHLGTEYAVLLVDPKYQVPSTTPNLPAPGAGLFAIARVNGRFSAEKAPHTPKPVRFSGYDWQLRVIPGDRGGFMRTYDPANARIDKSGFLHLTVTRSSGKWVCAEAALIRSLGYGTYSFTVKDVTRLEPAADLEMFTWSDRGIDQNHHEMDINISRRGDPESKNAEYVVQPFYVPSNVSRFTVPAGLMTYSFDWEPESISFRTRRGEAKSKISAGISDRVFISGVPTPGDETAHINFCAFGYSKVPLQHDSEVVIENFQYLP